MKTRLLLTVIVSTMVWAASCEKQESKLTDDPLYNPFEPGNDVELAQIDSVKKMPNFGTYLNVYFSVNTQYFANPNDIARVIVYRNGASYASVYGNQRVYSDYYIFQGETYTYEVAFQMTDGSITKKSAPFYIQVF